MSCTAGGGGGLGLRLRQLHFRLAGLGVGTGVNGTQGSFSPPAFLHGPTVALGAQMFSGAGLTSALRGAGAAGTFAVTAVTGAGTSFAKAGRVPGGLSKVTSSGAATCAPGLGLGLG